MIKGDLKINLEKITLKTLLKGALVVSVFALILIGIIIQSRPVKWRMRESDIALKPVYAPYDFTYFGAVDESKTQQERLKAKKAIREIYSLSSRPMSDALTKLDEYLKYISQLRQESIKSEIQEKSKSNIKEQFKVKAQDDSGIVLAASTQETLVKAEDFAKSCAEIKDLLASIYLQGILASADKTRLREAAEKKIIILDTNVKSERTVDIEKTPDYDEAVKDIYNNTKKVLTDKKLVSSVSELLQNLLMPNLFFESQLTELRRQEASDTVPLQYQQIEVKKGQLIIGKGQRVLKEHIDQLVAIEGNEISVSKRKFILGVSLLLLMLWLIITIYIVNYEPKIFNNTSYLALIGVLSVAMIFIARAIMVSPLPSSLIPLASVSMLLAILLNPRLAIFVTVFLSIAVGINIENSLNVTMMFLFGGIIGIFSVRNIRHRKQIIASGILVGLTNCAIIIAAGLLNDLPLDAFKADCGWGFANGIICAFIVMGILPLLEDLFKITTNITLLELADMDQPLMKEMILKAPGTYHHSLMVGNLAEAAAEAIGANSLLAKVGAYYHDVGKIEKSEYFTENQVDAKSLHDELTPSMSRLIITNHVKDGVLTGKKYKLNKAILDFIEQHHGTSLVFYFFQKALERIEDDSILKEEGFRYLGPKPQTKEVAIVLLADSVEAASRSLASPTPAKAEEIVHRIINNKFIDGQLDECELTLKDLNKIAEVFVRILMGILHTRIDYSQEENSNENRHN